ncbi:hypothetical protein Q9314_13360 [Shinella sumterensis]|nr:hypothetical protein Q9314_13360 [Shinella sumterensis]
MNINQMDLAAACGVSQSNISEWLQTMHASHRVDDEAALLALTVAQLRLHGFTGPVAARLVGEMRKYIEFAAIKTSNQAWAAFFDFEGRQHCVAAVSTTNLAAIMASKPVCLVIALHELVARAAERLEELKATKQEAANA